MTSDEKHADTSLLTAKAEIRRAFNFVDPSAADPLAQAILKVLDDIDAARRRLKARIAASGNPPT